MKYVYSLSSNPYECSCFDGSEKIALANGYKKITDDEYEKLLKHQLKWSYGELVENNDPTTDDDGEVGVIYGFYEFSHTQKIVDTFFNKGYRVIPIESTRVRRAFNNLVFAMNVDDYIYNYIKKRKPNTVFIGRSASHKLCNDKWKTYEYLSKYGIPQPYTSLISENIPYPKIIKVRQSSFGVGVFYAKDKEEEVDVINRCDPNFIMYQEYIEASKGKDICVYVLDGQCIAAMKRENTSENEFRSQTIYGAKATAYELSDAEKELSIKIADTIGISFCSINYLIDKDGILKVCDVNSNPGLDVIQDATGVDVASKYVDYLISYLGPMKKIYD